MDIIRVKSKQQEEDAYHVRREVFVHEQQVPEEMEMDEHDQTALHFVGYEDGKPVAAARLRFSQGHGKLERVCVLQDYRGRSFGQQMMKEMESVIKEYSFNKAKLNAQTQAESFYETLGYVRISDKFLDAGIPHVTMVKELKE
ncbi:GNAT family N-acetyltransferase [Halobacillus litoralis]|uniref:GNAT family N-acetyltransferase n=1 Tax=Halobacillus litoralis TaxID=45668 RepID=UPI001CFD2E1C|nr:GNAT family N-acetyltransferase [Halobacillus litoralis]